MTLKYTFAPAVGIAALLLSDPTLAVGTDYKIYPGAQCQAVNRSTGGNLVTSSFGDLTNRNTSNREVVCPITRDLITPVPMDPGVRVQSSGGRALTCSFNVMTTAGDRLLSVSRSTASSAATPLIFGPIQALNQATAGAYTFSCILPPGGKVISYSNGETYGNDFNRTDRE